MNGCHSHKTIGTIEAERDLAGVGDLPLDLSAPPLIVVAEDDEAVLAGYRALLESWGYRVAGGPTLEEVMEEIAASHLIPAMIVADLRLAAGQDGVAVVSALREHFALNTPALLISGEITGDFIRHAQGSGIPLLLKPVNAGRLRQILTSHIGEVPPPTSNA